MVGPLVVSPILQGGSKEGKITKMLTYPHKIQTPRILWKSLLGSTTRDDEDDKERTDGLFLTSWIMLWRVSKFKRNKQTKNLRRNRTNKQKIKTNHVHLRPVLVGLRIALLIQKPVWNESSWLLIDGGILPVMLHLIWTKQSTQY